MIAPTLNVAAASGSRSGLPSARIGLNVAIRVTNCREVVAIPGSIWLIVGARKAVPADARTARLDAACQRTPTLGSRLFRP